MRIIMRKSTVFLMGVALVALSMASAKAEPAATTTTEIQSPDGTTTTVIAPGAAAPQAVPPVVAPTATTGTTVVVDPPVAIDAITGKPVSNTTAPTPKEESLRNRVRDKMEKSK